MILRVGRGEGNEEVCVNSECNDGLFLSFASRVAPPAGETANDQVAGPTETGAGHKTGLCEVEG